MRSSINFNHLECFFSLAQTLSFSECSKKLGIAQPAVSKQIKTLEDSYQTQFFLRTKQKVQLTKAGKDLYELLSPLYTELLSRHEQYLCRSEEIHGEIEIGVLKEFGKRVLLPLLLDFDKKFKKITLRIHLLKGDDIIHKVSSGELDIGIVTQSITQESIRSYLIFTESILLVTNSRNEQGKRKIDKTTPFVAYRSDDPLLQGYIQKAYPKGQRFRPHVDFAVNSHDSIIEVLKKTDRFGVLPKRSVEKEIRKGTLVSVGPKILKSPLYLIYKDLDFPEKKIETLVKFLKSEFKGR